MNFVRRTVRNAVSFSGLGLHSGNSVEVTVNPGESGIAFRSGPDRVLARPENVSNTQRCTQLGSVSTIEHLMSALAALEITDAEIEVTGGELPGLDGSALPFYRGLNAVSTEEIGEGHCGDIFRRLFLPEDSGRTISVSKGEGHWRYLFDLGPRWPGEQAFKSKLDDYEAEIAPARTLVLSEELEMAMKAGLGKGLTEESVLIIDPTGYRNFERFPDEPARHKLLDLIGDLYLSGVPIRFLNVVAERTGHRINVAMAKMLAEAATMP
ncbi:UDP-3-O-acyl-N-acetylglucosamine deacetylase [soil metagenome]